MSPSLRSVVLPIFLLLLLCCSWPVAAGAHILEVASRQYVPLAAVIADLKEADFIFIGELHDRSDHHAAQLQIIEALAEEGETMAIGLEMIRAEDQVFLDRWVGGELAEEEFLPIFNDNWSMWPLYRPIFLLARDRGIPLLGLNISREISGQVASEGFASLSPEQLARLPGVACDVDPQYLAFIRRSLGAHAHGMKNFLNFCEAQMLWDAVMARTLLDFHQAHPDHTVVTLAGSGHAWKFGIPAQIERVQGSAVRVLLPEIAGRLEATSVSFEVADYLLLGTAEGPLH